MTKLICKAKTRSGQRCRLPASDSGYCHVHDPARLEEKEKALKDTQRIQAQKSRKLKEVLDVIVGTAEAKGWEAYVGSLDRKNWRYATVDVSRQMYTPLGSANAAGLFEVTLDSGVKVVRTVTSFHHYGFQDLHDAIMFDLERLPWLSPRKSESSTKDEEGLAKLLSILQRFHTIARQLQHRHGDRETLVIHDEYDLQDLLHALLRMMFDDIRPEEYTPSYAGKSSRIDFLLKNERTAVETKFASERLKDKDIGDQLIIDIGRYQNHPGCSRLVCFVYDPNGWIRNPIALETDLSGKSGNLDVSILVLPK